MRLDFPLPRVWKCGDDAVNILRNTFGFQDFAGSRAGDRRVMGGAHTLAVMPKGAGKSLCYQVRPWRGRARPWSSLH